MEFSEYLSTNIPKVKVNRSKITIDTSFSEVFDLKIENIAGGFLSGEIKKYDYFIELSTYKIDKNHVDLKIKVNKDLIESGRKYNTLIRIFTNGGDIEVLVEIINEKRCFKVSNTVKFFTIKDMYTYSRDNIMTLSNLFDSHEFISWISFLGNDILEIYNFIKDDKNVYRKIDNFFILLGLKNRSEIIYDEKIEVEILPFQETNIVEFFILKKSEHGFVDVNLSFLEEYDFIKLDKYRINNSDFINNDEIAVYFTIDVAKVKNKKEYVHIILNDDINKKIEICIKKVVNLRCSINKTIYKDNEIGFIFIENYLETPINFQATSTSKNINILKNIGKIEKTGKVEFKVNLTNFNKGIVKFFNQPYFDGEIDILFSANDLKVKKAINITIATDNLEFE